jgi:hypothetical protein
MDKKLTGGSKEEIGYVIHITDEFSVAQCGKVTNSTIKFVYNLLLVE